MEPNEAKQTPNEAIQMPNEANQMSDEANQLLSGAHKVPSVVNTQGLHSYILMTEGGGRWGRVVIKYEPLSSPPPHQNL